MNKNTVLKFAFFAMLFVSLFGCKKWSADNQDLYQYVPAPAKPISDSAPLCGSIAGTMLSGKTYIINCDVYINPGDSLLIQPGVKIYFRNQAAMIVRGRLFSLGSEANPIWFTAEGQTKKDKPKIDYKAKDDSAFKGIWKGIIGTETCDYMVLKWTHIEYCGAVAGSNNSSAYSYAGLKSTDDCYAMYFSNLNGYFVFEDSWIYGTVDDAIRIAGTGGKFAILRSTFEKCGKSGGDILNIKAGGLGDMAYNLFIGGATNSLKAANSGVAAGIPDCNARVYNNTILHSGHRQKKTGRGGSINFETNGARGMVFNNLMVNCKFGLRLSTDAPDTSYFYAGNYGYNYYWADDLSVANQIIPYTPGSVIKPTETDFPKPSTYLPANYVYNPAAAYDGSKAVQVGNPLFVDYPLPVTGGFYLADMNAIGNFNFNLQAGSPCIGAGYTNFSPLKMVPVDAQYGVTEYTLPGKDIGCYQFNGTGNRH